MAVAATHSRRLEDDQFIPGGYPLISVLTRYCKYLTGILAHKLNESTLVL
jgi:hypothetical protein